MSRDPRRRRLPPDRPGGSGIPIFPLILVVIFAGLLLGGLIAHFSQKRDGVVPAAASPLAITPIPAITPSPSITPSAPVNRPSSSASPLLKTTRTASPVPSQPASAAAKRSSFPSASAVPSVIIVTPEPKRPTETAAAASAMPVEGTPGQGASALKSEPPTGSVQGPSISSNDAAGVVRGYLSALARGDESTAASYLRSGLPSETFMSAAARITSIRSARSGDGTFSVSADIKTSDGEYFENFTVQSGENGLQIIDHTAIKP
ncbi:MAG: hypothetical protein M3R51_04065 [Candidatus Eremiobacteraeota bacterium]|nr:hypothetical protein [Candidatus Eremiobacteraeota bacterium]